MTTVKISPMSELQEVKALVEHYRNRNLLLSQAVEECQAVVAERDARIVELEALLPPPADAPAETIEAVH